MKEDVIILEVSVHNVERVQESESLEFEFSLYFKPLSI